jgi:MFS family permease
MLAGRAFQGVGSGVILSLVEIVLADVVSLSERCVIFRLVLSWGISNVHNMCRGSFQGAFGAVWALASATGSSHLLHFFSN